MILTDHNGRPIERPEPPAADADIETKIAHIRAKHAYNDRVANIANKAFTENFKP